MNKGRLILAFVGGAALIVGFIILFSSIRRLPPEVVKPNARTAFSNPSKINTLEVPKTSQQPTELVSTSPETSGTAGANQNQAQPLATPGFSEPVNTPLATPTTNNIANVLFSSSLQGTLLNITSGLNQQEY